MLQALRVSPDVIDLGQNHLVLPSSKVRRHYCIMTMPKKSVRQAAIGRAN